MQNQTNENRFWVDPSVGEDDVTLPSLPVVDVPIIETPRVLEQFAEQPNAVAAKPENGRTRQKKPMRKYGNDFIVGSFKLVFPYETRIIKK
jgi:fused signal recognition particle receptor